MWALIAVVIIALLLILTAPKPKVENARAAKLGDFQFPRSNQGDPIPWFRGTVRLKSPNTLWDGDYTPVPITVKQKTGLFSSKRVTTGYRYHIGLDLCWALNGPNTITVRKLWSDKYVLWTGNVSTRSTIDINQPNLFGGQDQRGGMIGSIDFYPGSFDEPQNSYLAQKADPDVPAYIGQCRMVFRGSANTQASGFYFGTTTTINALSAEMSCFTSHVDAAHAVMPNGFDLNPMEVLYDCFTEQFGMLGTDVGDIDMPSWQAAALTLYNELMGMSILVQTSVTGKDIADEVLRVADGILYQNPDTGKIICKLIRDDYVIADLIVLDQSTVMELSDFSKTTWDQAFNQCRVTFTNRSDDYANGVATQQDFALLNFQGKVRNTDISMPGCYDPTEATALAARQLSLMSVPLFQIEIRCKRQAAFLNPGDVFMFNWAPYGLSNMVMRIQKIDKGTLEDGTITINAIQDRFASALAIFAPPTPTNWVPVDSSAKPVATRLFFEAPKWFQQFLASNLTDGQAAWYVGAKPPGQASVGMDVQTSVSGSWNDTVDSQLQYVYNGSFVLQTALLNTDGRANGLSATGFTVELVDRSNELINQAGSFDGSGQWLILVDGEFMQPATMVNNGDGTFTFTNVYRALLDSDFTDHVVGAVGYLIKQGDGLLEVQTSDTATLHARILDITPTSTLDPTQALVDNVVGNMRARRAAPPDYVQLNGSRTPVPFDTSPASAPLSVSWNARDRLAIALQPYSATAQVPEAGTDFGVRYRINGGAWTAFTYVAASPTTIEMTGKLGDCDVQVWSRLNNLLSLVGDTCSIHLGAMHITTSAVFIQQGTAGTYQMQATGTVAPVTWTVDPSTPLPSGVTMDSSGLITYDSTTTAQNINCTFHLSDSASQTTSASIPVNVQLMTNTKWWRVKVLDSNGTPNYGSMQELEFRSSVAGPTLCVGGTPFASSYYVGYLPSKAFDGDVTSSTSPECWAANGTSDSIPVLGYELQNPSIVSEIMICARHVTPSQTPKDFTIQSSIDSTTGLDGTWIDEWSVTNQTGWAAGEIRVFARP